MKYQVYTDGACSGNPGPGGYAFIILKADESPLIVSGHNDETTNNHMELKAIVRSLKYLVKQQPKGRLDITLYSDSAYCVNSINYGWLNFWKKNGWKTKQNKDVKNKELWEKYTELIEAQGNRLSLTVVKVKGHAGNEYNELVDKYAKSAINRQKGQVAT